MQCTHCGGSDIKVIESRDVADNQAIRRRRECNGCQRRFTTYERIERPQLIVIKHDKTSVTSMQLEQLASDVEDALYACGESEVSSSKIGDLVMERLAPLSEVAYVRFACVYRRFTDIDSFEKELGRLRGQK